MIATLVNFNLQAVVIRHGFPFHSVNHNHMLRRFLDGMDGKVEDMPEFERGPLLGRQIAQIRPELDLYLVTDVNVEAIAAQVGEVFKRIFFGEEDHIELYSSIMKGGRAPPHALLQRPARLCQAAHRRVPCAAAGARQGDHEQQLDRRHGAVLRHEPVHGRNVRHLRRPGFAAGSGGAAEAGPGIRRPRLRRAAPTSPPTARPPATRSWCRRWSSPTTSCWWTGTATSRTTTAWCWPARRWPTWTPIRWMNSRCTARCRCATSRKRC